MIGSYFQFEFIVQIQSGNWNFFFSVGMFDECLKSVMNASRREHVIAYYINFVFLSIVSLVVYSKKNF